MTQDGQKCSRLVKMGGFCLNKVYILLVLISVTEMLTQFDLSHQLYIHRNVNAINTQPATCFDTS